MTLVERPDAIDRFGGRIGDASFHVLAQGRLIGFDGQKIVCSGIEDILSDLPIACDRIDHDHSTLQAAVVRRALEKKGS